MDEVRDHAKSRTYVFIIILSFSLPRSRGEETKIGAPVAVLIRAVRRLD